MDAEKRTTNDEPNLVAGFKVAAILNKKITGACIKYTMYDGTERLCFFPISHLKSLHKCLEYFSAMHYYGSDMQRVADDPAFAASLADDHAVHTMERMKPVFTDSEFNQAQNKFCVGTLAVADGNKTCIIHLNSTAGQRRTDILPEFTAMNLFGFLCAVINPHNLLLSETLGSA